MQFMVDGGALVATVPEIVALHLLRKRPHPRTAPLPLPHSKSGLDLL